MNYQKPEIVIYEAEELLKIEANAGGSSSCGVGSCGTGLCTSGVCGINLNG